MLCGQKTYYDLSGLTRTCKYCAAIDRSIINHAQLLDEESPSCAHSLSGLCCGFARHLQSVGTMGTARSRDSTGLAPAENLEKKSQLAIVIDGDRDRGMC